MNVSELAIAFPAFMFSWAIPTVMAAWVYIDSTRRGHRYTVPMVALTFFTGFIGLALYLLVYRNQAGNNLDDRLSGFVGAGSRTAHLFLAGQEPTGGAVQKREPEGDESRVPVWAKGDPSERGLRDRHFPNEPATIAHAQDVSDLVLLAKNAHKTGQHAEGDRLIGRVFTEAAVSDAARILSDLRDEWLNELMLTVIPRDRVAAEKSLEEAVAAFSREDFAVALADWQHAFEALPPTSGDHSAYTLALAGLLAAAG